MLLFNIMTPESSPTHPKWRAIVTAILIAEGITVGAFAVTVPILAFILSDLFGLIDDELIRWNSLIFIVSSLAMAIFSPIWGSLADKMGKRLMLVRAMLGGMIVVFLMIFVQTPTHLVILRAFQGAFTGSIAAATVLLLAFTPKEHTASVLALLQVVIYIGNSIGPLIGGKLFDTLRLYDIANQTQIASRANFLFTSLLLGISALIVVKFVPKDTKYSKAQKKERAKKQSDTAFNLSTLTHNRILLTLLFLTFIVSISFSLVNPIFPLFIREMLEDAEHQLGTISGLITGSAALTVALGAIVFARLGKRLPMHILVIIAIIGAGVFYIPQVYVTRWQTLLIFRLIWSFFVGGITPGANYLISHHAVKEQHGTIFGINASLNSIGMALGPALGGIIVVHFGFSAVFLTGATLLLALSVILIFINQNKPSPQPAPKLLDLEENDQI